MNSPHDSESWTTDFIKGFPACYHFPEDNAPAEDITLFTVIATYEKRQGDLETSFLGITETTSLINYKDKRLSYSELSNYFLRYFQTTV